MDVAHVNIHRVLTIALVALAACAAMLLGRADEARADAVFGGFWADRSASQPNGLEPASGTNFNYPQDHVELRWDPVGGARQYYLQLANSSSFSSGSIIAAGLVDAPKYVPTQLMDDGTYYWRVRPQHGARTGIFSAAKSFNVVISGSPSGLAFHDDSGAVAATSALGGYLSWNGVDGAAAYDVQVAATDSFSPSSIVVDVDSIPNDRLVIPRLPDDTYHWRVRTVWADGDTGSWVSAASSFTILWDSINGGAITPADGAAMSQWRLGWDPVRGTSRYQVQAGTHSSCFFDPESTPVDNRPDHSPGVNVVGPVGVPWCRVSHEETDETINNWMTSEIIPHREIFDNTDLDSASFAPVPPYEWSNIYWRVRPVVDVNSGNESLWPYKTSSVKIRGEWSRTPGNSPYNFTLGAAAGGSAGATCISALNPLSPACLESLGSTMSPSDASDDSVSMQMPLLEWTPFDTTGAFAATLSDTLAVCDRFTDGGADGSSGTLGGGLIAACVGTKVEIAADPAFDSILHEMVIRDGKGRQASTALFDGAENSSELTTALNTLPDNELGSGYWWRATPCIFYGSQPSADGLDHWKCIPAYYPGLAGLAGGGPGAGARMFTKRATFGSGQATTENFAGSMPLLEWDRIDGADHYEVQISQNNQFTGSSTVDLNTTGNMFVPYRNSSWSEPADGTWYWRVRAVDYNDVTSEWSSTDSFVKQTPAPSLVGPADGASRELPVLEWNPVSTANRYQVVWSTDDTFPSARTSGALTSQTGYMLDVSPGTYYWRVRVYDGGSVGSWSDERQITVSEGDELLYSVNRNRIFAGQSVFVRGELTVAGQARSGDVIRLQRKQGGSYKTVSWTTTGSNAETGAVRLGHRPRDNSTYRLARIDGSRWHYSAPFNVRVKPRIRRAKFSTNKLRRGRRFRVGVQLNRAITGQARVEYRYAGKWRVAGRRNITRDGRFSVPARINRSGKFKVRLHIVNMPNYYNTTSSAKRVRLNDLWRYYG